MSPRFLAFWSFLMEWEGRVYENDPDDPGGATKFGIDQRSHPRVNIRQLTEDQAKEIYWTEYWTKNSCEGMANGLGEVFFNACVNCGRARADKLLRASGSTASGFLDAQETFYKNLASARAASRKYLKGWLNRTTALRRFLHL